jgi:hypothetical protein
MLLRDPRPFRPRKEEQDPAREPANQVGTRNALVRFMSGGSSKFISRIVVLLFMGLALAGCFAMLSSGDRSLFADIEPAVGATAMIP